MKAFFLFLFSVRVSFSIFGQVDTVYLYIESGELELANGASAQYIVYSNEDLFNRNSSLIIKEQGQEVCFKVKNNDTQVHGFELSGLLGLTPTINPGEFGLLTLTLTQSGVFKYFDPVNDPYFSHVGLSGTLHVKNPSDLTSYFTGTFVNIKSTGMIKFC